MCSEHESRPPLGHTASHCAGRHALRFVTVIIMTQTRTRCLTWVVVWAAVAAAQPRASAHEVEPLPDGLPLPTPAQLRYERAEIVSLTCFNTATYVGNGE